jgi:hypothetical protein
MKITIDVDAVINEAVKHMEDEDDLRFSVGIAMQELYWDIWEQVQERMVKKYYDGVKENTYS